MFKLDSEDALRNAFRPKDRPAVEVTKEVATPLFVRDYVAWAHPGGHYMYLVFATPGGAPTGVVFESPTGGVAPVPMMCDWCRHTGVGSSVGLLTARLTASKRVGVHVCSDLSCKQKLEDEANRSGRSVLPMMEKLIARMGRFAQEALKIDLSGAGR